MNSCLNFEAVGYWSNIDLSQEYQVAGVTNLANEQILGVHHANGSFDFTGAQSSCLADLNPNGYITHKKHITSGLDLGLI